MKKLYVLFLFIATTIGYSQTNGISYQALILNPNPKMMPGINQPNTALANQAICLQFVIEDNGNQVEYQETLTTTTDELGMVNVIIGSGTQTGGYAIDFKSVSWNAATKTLKVSINTSGSCGSFTAISDQVFNAVPFAFTAKNVTGVVAIANGGTNATTVTNAKINLNLGNVDNTSDSNKPISNATQTALNTKAAISGQVFTGAVAATNLSGLNTGDQDLSSLASNVALGNKVDKVTAKSLLLDTEITRLSTLTNSDTNKAYVDAQDATNTNAIAAEKNRALAAEEVLSTNVVINTAKVGITSSQANEIISNTNNLDLKANIASPIFTGTPLAPTAIAGTNTTQIATTEFVTDAITTVSTSTNFVNLTTNQTISGTKNFTSDATINGVTVGRGKFNENSNTAVGLGALEANAGYANTGIGKGTLAANIGGSGNTALGYIALSANTAGTDNIAIGSQALKTNLTGSGNIAVGSNALYLNNGNYNTAIGNTTLENNTSGSNNIGLGPGALYYNTTGSNNVGIGKTALQNTTTGGSNTAVGNQALYANTSGDVNTAVGENALVSNTTGRYNTSVGVQSQEQNTNGQSNTAIGVAAIDRNSTGSNNAVLGAFAGRYISDGSTSNTTINNSVLIGSNSKPLADNGNNEIVIGYNANGNGSNTIQLGNTDVTNVNTSGTITAGAVIYTKTDGTIGQVLTTNGSGVTSWGSPSTTATAFSGTLPVANGGTGTTTLEANNLLLGNGTSAVQTLAPGTAGNVLTSNGTIWTSVAVSSGETTHSIGDIYGGGMVIWVTTDGLHGIIVETVDQTNSSTGYSTWYNAQNIISTNSNHSTAGKLYTDWRLPTLNELNLLFNEKGRIGTMNNQEFWSSTEADNGNSLYVTFNGSGVAQLGSKTSTFRVRAIRIF